MLNLKKAKEKVGDGDYELLTPGRYIFTIESGQEKKSKSGNLMLEFTLTVEGPKFKNRKLWANFSLIEKAQVYLIRFIEACGKEELTNREDATSEDIIKALQGSVVSGYVDQEKGYDGKLRNIVKNFTATEGNTVTGSSEPEPKNESAKSKLFK